MRQQRRLPWWLPVAAVQALVREQGLAQSLRALAQQVPEQGLALALVQGLVQGLARQRRAVQWHHRNPGLQWRASSSHHASTTRSCRSSM